MPIDKRLYNIFADMSGYLLIAAIESSPFAALDELNVRYDPQTFKVLIFFLLLVAVITIENLLLV